MKVLAGGKDDVEPMEAGDDAEAVDNAGFDAAADEVFSAMESKDAAAFSEALKSCIEMMK